MKTTIRVPATTANLGPGFDSLGLALALHNEVTVTSGSVRTGIRLAVVGFGAGSLPMDRTNLIVRSAERLLAEAGRPVPGLLFESRNGFPGSSGLGSSSAAILLGLLAGNSVLEAPFSRADLLDLAARIEGHPDNVTPALLGGLTISMVAGGRVTARRVAPDPAWRVAVAVPDLAVSTQAMRAALPRMVPRADAVHNLSRVPLVVQAFQQADLDLLRIAITDRLHQPYRLPLIRGAPAALEAASGSGAAAALSGAGPGVIAFTLSDVDAEAAAEAMQEAFLAEGVGCWVWTGGVDLQGAVVEVG